MSSLGFAQADAELRGPDYPRIARFYGAGVWKGVKKEHLDFVSKYDLLVGGVGGNVDKEVAYLREKNPQIKILLYRSIKENKAGDKDVKDSWWLRTMDGEYVSDWPGQHKLNLTMPEVVDFVVDDILAKFHKASFTWDGIFFDCFEQKMRGRRKFDFDGDGKPDDKKELNAKWKAGVNRIVSETFRRTGGKLLYMVNSWYLVDGPYEYLNGCLGEGVIDRIYYGKSHKWTWESNLALYHKWMKLGRKPCLVSLVNGSGKIHDPWERRKLSKEEKEADLEEARKDEKRMRFGLTTTLMGDGYFAYNAYTSRGDWWYKEYDAPLGYPAADARKMPDGTWQRRYDGGLVVVNPTKKEVSVRLEGDYVDATTEKTVSTLTLAGQDGRVLIAPEKWRK
ncbi:MAG: hypothetical protein GXP25_12530 [Planctomycetes bacterium]|nr:hypothetical protein [Planctomycetota bacterium]